MASWTKIKSAFAKHIFCGQINNTNNILEPKLLLQQCIIELIQKFGGFMYEFKSPVKLNCELVCEYIFKKNNEDILTKIYHTSKMTLLTISDDFNSWYVENVQDQILQHLSEFQERDSGKAINQISYLQVNICKYNSTNSGGSSYIDLPENNKNKKAVVNVKNLNDEKCFIWAILAGLYNVSSHPVRISQYPQNHGEIFNLSNIAFSTPLSDIVKFENLNNNISINVYGLEFNSKLKIHTIVGPLYYTKCKKDNHINLLYIKENEQSHYAWIKSLSRLISSQLSKKKRKKVYLRSMLTIFWY